MQAFILFNFNIINTDIKKIVKIFTHSLTNYQLYKNCVDLNYQLHKNGVDLNYQLHKNGVDLNYQLHKNGVDVNYQLHKNSVDLLHVVSTGLHLAPTGST